MSPKARAIADHVRWLQAAAFNLDQEDALMKRLRRFDAS